MCERVQISSCIYPTYHFLAIYFPAFLRKIGKAKERKMKNTHTVGLASEWHGERRKKKIIKWDFLCLLFHLLLVFYISISPLILILFNFSFPPEKNLSLSHRLFVWIVRRTKCRPSTRSTHIFFGKRKNSLGMMNRSKQAAASTQKKTRGEI